MTDDYDDADRDELDEKLKALLAASAPDEGSSWPELEPVPIPERRRVWCLMTALEIAQNAGGRPAVDTAKDAIQAASMFDDWISDSKVPRRPSIVREDTP